MVVFSLTSPLPRGSFTPIDTFWTHAVRIIAKTLAKELLASLSTRA